MDAEGNGCTPDTKLIQLIADAFDTRQLIMNNPRLSINQIAKQEGRCRKQLTKLLSLSWLSPRIIESMMSGIQPKTINRTILLETTLPAAWGDQEELFCFDS